MRFFLAKSCSLTYFIFRIGAVFFVIPWMKILTICLSTALAFNRLGLFLIGILDLSHFLISLLRAGSLLFLITLFLLSKGMNFLCSLLHFLTLFGLTEIELLMDLPLTPYMNLSPLPRRMQMITGTTSYSHPPVKDPHPISNGLLLPQVGSRSTLMLLLWMGRLLLLLSSGIAMVPFFLLNPILMTASMH